MTHDVKYAPWGHRELANYGRWELYWIKDTVYIMGARKANNII